MWKRCSTALTVVLAASVLGHAQAASETGAVKDGHDLFATYCASCHGRSGRGDGPAAGEFGRRPADLTQLAERNGGIFNGPRIYSIVDGRSVKAHGTMEMPVWGDAFKWHEGLPDEVLKARIEALVRYLETIQRRTGH